MEKGHLTSLMKPEYEQIGSQIFLDVPVSSSPGNPNLGPEYVLRFLIGRRGPSRQDKVIYQAEGLGEITPAAKRHAWHQAYAIWKKSPPSARVLV